MKKTTTLLLLLTLIVPHLVLAQWTAIPSNTVGKLESVYFWNATTGMMSNSYELIKTTDAGLTWTPVTGYYGVRDIDFANANTGYSAGVAGSSLRKTTNGGVIWSSLTPPNSNSLWGVSSPDPSIAYVSGTGGVVWKTTNGTSFTEVNLPSTNLAVDVDFVSTSEGYVLAQQEGVYKTTSGGSSWSLSYASTGSLYTSIYFVNATTGFACGSNGRIIRTTNAGSTWTVLNTGSTGLLEYIYFYDSTHGICVGYNGEVLRTTNGGTTWFHDNIPGTAHLHACMLLSPTIAIVAGDSGVIYRNANLGNSISDQSLPEAYIHVYPNPCSGSLSITADELPLNASLHLDVYSIEGKLMASLPANTSAEKNIFNTAALVPGIYIGALYNREEKIASIRFLKLD